MPDVGFGGSNSGGSWSASGHQWSDGIGLPVGRSMANGSQACLIVALYGYIGGRGASRSVRLVLGSAGTGWFTVPAQSNSGGTGWFGTNHWLVQGGSTRINFYSNGAVYFGKGGGGTVQHGSGSGWPGTLGGAYRYVMAPVAPGNFTATAHPTIGGRVDLSWTYPSDDGGTGITDYYVFHNGSHIATTGAGSYAVTGLTPGTSHTFFIRARNAVTIAAGTTSVSTATKTVVAQGLPSEPLNLVATPSTDTFGRISLTWDPPTNTAGGITRYNVYAGATLLGSPTTTSYVADGLTPAQMYSFTVRAKNAYGDSISDAGPPSTAAGATAPGPPSAPRNLAAVASETIAGQISLSWDVPVTTAGGITGYTIYHTTGAVLATLTGTGTTYVANLVPGTEYRFYVRARNAISDTVGTHSPASNTVIVSAVGDPEAPTNLVASASPNIPERIVLTWTPPVGFLTGINVYRNGTFIGSTQLSTFNDDFRSPGTYTYTVAARNAATDFTGTTGPHSAPASSTPGTLLVQAVDSMSANNTTNVLLNGTYTLVSPTASTISYARSSAAAIPLANVPSGAGSVIDNTNVSLNGTHIMAVTSPTSVSYTSAGDVFTERNTSETGTITDDTNVGVFNGNYTVLSVDEFNDLVRYERVAPDVSERDSVGKIINRSNEIYNGESLTLVEGTEDSTLVYDRTGASPLGETGATGSAYNRTNETIFNGVHEVESVPSFNLFTYTVDPDIPLLTADIDTASTGEVVRVNSKAKLKIKYRSGWLG